LAVAYATRTHIIATMDRDGRSTAAVMVAGVAGGALLLLALAVFSGSAGYGYDLAAYLSAAARVAAGGTPYQPQTLGGPFNPGPAGLYLYPPPLAVLLAPFAGLATTTIEAGWWIGRVALLVGGCAAMPVPRWVRGAVLLVLAISYPTLIDLNLGNVSLLVLVASCLTWRWLDRPASGVVTAVAMALRPTLVVVLIWWLVRRRWQPILWALGGGLVLIVLTLPFVGVGGYTDYLAVVRNLSNVTGVPRNVDLASAALLLGLGPGAVQPALVVQYGLGLGALLLAMRQDPEVGFVMVTAASLLLAPLIWVHYLVVLALPAALLAARGLRWAVLLPLLGWLPEPALPLVAIAGAYLPLLAARRPAASG
jgi:Glycosyltransferase family 87